MSRQGRRATGGPPSDDTAGRARLRRTVLVVTGAAGMLLLTAAVAFACTTYYGTVTIENVDRGSSVLTLVGNPDNGMDRCEDGTSYSSSDNVEAYNGTDDGNGDGTKGPDTVRVEIDEYETSTDECGLDGTQKWETDSDKDEIQDHSIADATSGTETVDVNVYDGDAYHDECLLQCQEDDVFQDFERFEDCMDDSNSDVVEKLDGIDVDQDGDGDDGTDNRGEFDRSDSRVTNDDGDDVAEVEIDIEESVNSQSGGSNDPDHAAAICVAEDDGIGYSAPQAPIIIK